MPPPDRPARGLRRALRHDGWHGTRQTPEEAQSLVHKLRATRPGPDSTISLRTSWDGKNAQALKSRHQAYTQAGSTHVMIEPTDREPPDWLRSVETIAKAGGLQGARREKKGQGSALNPLGPAAPPRRSN
jgi:hypothetical protein